MVHGAARQREIERAVRAHPAGRALPGRAGGRPPGGGRVRLTARGRRLLLVLTLASGVALVALLHGLVAGGTGGLHLAGQDSVVVQPGDTLWSIATSVAGDGDDVRVVVGEIRQANGLHGSELQPGEVLRLP